MDLWEEEAAQVSENKEVRWPPYTLIAHRLQIDLSTNCKQTS
jgi:hypothetical protein